MAENKQAVGFYDLVKNCKGGLVLNLPAFDSSSINRRVEFKWNVDKIRVPRVYALGIFIDGTLERMYKEGVFRVEPAAAFEREVANIFFPVEDKTEVISNDQLKEYLLKGNRAKIKELINNNSVARDNIIVLVRENIGDLSTSMIKDLEKMLGVELVVEDE